MDRRPKVTITFAQSLDGRIATRTGASQWISGPETLDLAQRLRNDHDAVLVGIGTVLADNPRLTCRLPGGRSPVRVVLDSRLRTPETTEIIRTARETTTVLFCCQDSPAPRRDALAALGAEVVTVPEASSGRLDLEAVLASLADRGIRTLLVEGGSGVITSLIHDRLWDRMTAVMAPIFIGEGTSTVGDLGVTSLDAVPRGTTVRVSQAGQDIVWEVERADAG